MPNPPPKGDEEVPAHPQTTSARTHHTCSTAVSTDSSANPTQGNKTGSIQANLDYLSLLPLQHVASAISKIISKCKILSQAKLLLEGVIKYTKKEEARQKKLKDIHNAPSIANAIHKAIKER